MTPDEICAGYQAILRQVYPKAVVLKNTKDWIPVPDLYRAFFIPDDAAVEYMNRWIDGWYAEAQVRGLPPITLCKVNETETKENYAHLFPEIFGRTKSAKASRQGAVKRSKVKPAKSKRREAVSSSR